MKIHWTRGLALRAVRKFGEDFQGSALYYRWGERREVYALTQTWVGSMDVPLASLKSLPGPLAIKTPS